jgi:hypothetical protein
MSTTHYVFLIRDKEFRVGKMWVTARLPLAALLSPLVSSFHLDEHHNEATRHGGQALP